LDDHQDANERIPTLQSDPLELFSFHVQWVSVIAFSRDGKHIVNAPCKGAFSIWETGTGKKRGQLVGHQAAVSSLAFSRDNKKLASGSRDFSILIWDVSDLANEVRPRAILTDLNSCWRRLMSDNAAIAFDAVCGLSATPEQTVSFLSEHLRPALPPDASETRLLIADLDHEWFEIRKKSSSDLERLGEPVIPTLRKVLDGDVPVETRKRTDELLARLNPATPRGELLRTLRAIEVLETIGTPEALESLKLLAAGGPEARLTREAKASIERLERRAGK
jgi:hypothetical protein